MDLLIRSATLLDLESGKERICDVAVDRGRITRIDLENSGHTFARRVIEAGGMYLFPGFIDLHTHLFSHGSTFGMDADRLLSTGVTSAVDMGSAGWVNYPAFRQCDLAGKRLGWKSFLNLSPIGQPGKGISEPLSDDLISLERIDEIVNRYPGEIAGIKVRLSRSIVGELGIAPLKQALRVGEQLGLPVCVHTTDPPVPAGEIAALLRPGDIYSHMYQGQGNTILDPQGRVQDAVVQAQRRGVLLEVGNGRINFSFPIAEQAIACGVWPDIISSDATPATFHQNPVMWDLPFVLSKFLQLGMPLADVIRAATLTSARCLGISDRVGSLREGFDADLVLCRLEEKAVCFRDCDGNERTGSQVLVPALTIRAGRVVAFS